MPAWGWCAEITVENSPSHQQSELFRLSEGQTQDHSFFTLFADLSAPGCGAIPLKQSRGSLLYGLMSHDFLLLYPKPLGERTGWG